MLTSRPSLANEIKLKIPSGASKIVGAIFESSDSLTKAHTDVLSRMKDRFAVARGREVGLWTYEWGMLMTRLFIFAQTGQPKTAIERQNQRAAYRWASDIRSKMRQPNVSTGCSIRDLLQHAAFSSSMLRNYGDGAPVKQGICIRGRSTNVQVLATRAFKKGEEILRFRGKILSFEEAVAKESRKSDAFQIGDRLYLDLEDPGRSLNHSCEPNSIVTPDLRLRAFRKISQGEEITFDYSTTMAEDYWQMRCACGTESCRKVIRDFVTLPEKVQKKYLSVKGATAYVLAEASIHFTN